ncbi:APC family permease [Nocardia fusca]|uniref:APC family permease n=1 Tax=Nocardia fusca TaxID=941183 RepID=A0ABV3F1U6_9NOCA
MNTSALHAALRHAAVADPPVEPVYSPLRALGRSQLTPLDLAGQSMSTMAPATCMVFTALWMSAAGSHGVRGLSAVIGAVLVMALVALCIRQFTVRLAASGSLYSFVAHGLGKRATLTAGAALLVGYLGVSISVLSNAGADLTQVGESFGLPRIPAAIVCAGIAVAVALIAIRGVRFATRLILLIEVCTIGLILALLLQTPEPPAFDLTVTSVPFGLFVFLAMQTVLNLAGFESAAFFGPEAQRPLRTVTRTVLGTPLLVGALYIVAGWAGMSGHAGTLLNAYFGGTASGASPLLVLVVNIGVCSSWIASTLGFAQAGSRLLYSMSLERIIPAVFEKVQPRFRTPYACVALFVGISFLGTLWHTPGHGGSTAFDAVTEITLLLGYTLVAFAALRFLHRIGEHTPGTRVAGLAAAAAGSGLLAFAAVDAGRSGGWIYLAWCAALGISGPLWYAVLRRYRPGSIDAIGVFDSVETADLLPGAASLRIDEHGRPVLSPPGR